MNILLDWVAFDFSIQNNADVLIVAQDDMGYYLVCYFYEEEGYVTVWQEQHDTIDGISTNIKEPENSNEYYQAVIKNLLKGNII